MAVSRALVYMKEPCFLPCGVAFEGKGFLGPKDVECKYIHVYRICLAQ